MFARICGPAPARSIILEYKKDLQGFRCCYYFFWVSSPPTRKRVFPPLLHRRGGWGRGIKLKFTLNVFLLPKLHLGSRFFPKLSFGCTISVPNIIWDGDGKTQFPRTLGRGIIEFRIFGFSPKLKTRFGHFVINEKIWAKALAVESSPPRLKSRGNKYFVEQ